MKYILKTTDARQIPRLRAEITGSCLDGKRGLRGNVDRHGVPALPRHALRRIAEHVTLTELIEDLREGAHRRIAKAGAVQIAAGARRALADEVHLTCVGRRAPGADRVRIEVAAAADIDPVQHGFGSGAGVEHARAVKQTAAILTVSHRDD